MELKAFITVTTATLARFLIILDGIERLMLDLFHLDLLNG